MRYPLSQINYLPFFRNCTFSFTVRLSHCVSGHQHPASDLPPAKYARLGANLLSMTSFKAYMYIDLWMRDLHYAVGSLRHPFTYNYLACIKRRGYMPLSLFVLISYPCRTIHHCLILCATHSLHINTEIVYTVLDCCEMAWPSGDITHTTTSESSFPHSVTFSHSRFLAISFDLDNLAVTLS